MQRELRSYWQSRARRSGSSARAGPDIVISLRHKLQSQLGGPPRRGRSGLYEHTLPASFAMSRYRAQRHCRWLCAVLMRCNAIAHAERFVIVIAYHKLFESQGDE
jgi:hypothetical protein